MPLIEQVSRMFGALMLLVNGVENSAMSPVLATGEQVKFYFDFFFYIYHTNHLVGSSINP